MRTVFAGLRDRVFPDHWSFLLGQLAFYSFVVVVLSGLYLVFFYDPSMEQVTYDGSYVPLQGVEISKALESTLRITFEVRAGNLMRQVHHWATLLMVAAVMLHMLRLFFSAAFRRPRQLSWVVVVLILAVTMAAGFTGAVLPDDMLSGTSLVILDGVLKSVPFVGTRLSFLVFGGSFPGDVIARLYALHIVVLPVVLLVLFTVNGVLALIHKPAQFAGPGRTNGNVVGRPLRVFVVKSVGYFFVVVGTVTLVAATVTINPVWDYGPADPRDASAGASPEWYLGFLDGALRLVPPGWELVWLGRTWALGVLVPVTVVTLFLVTVAVYPFAEAWITGDRRSHHILERPRNNPTRTGIGVAGIVFYGVLWAAAGADTIATHFHLSIESVLHAFQALVVLGPVVGFTVTRRICVALQRQDREAAAHGVETGRIVRLPSGGYTEVRKPVDPSRRWRLVSVERHGPLTPHPDARGRIPRAQRLRARLSRFYFDDRVTPTTRRELVDNQPDGDRRQRRWSPPTRTPPSR